MSIDFINKVKNAFGCSNTEEIKNNLTLDVDRTLRLTDNQYYKEETDKKHIVLHHTVGGSAKSTFNYWQSTPDRIGTAYIIERDGTIYEVFDPKYWAHHLGLKLQKNTIYNKQSIGIELASEGALKSGKELNDSLGERKFDENYLYAFDISVKPYKNAKKLYNIVSDIKMYYKGFFRGFNYFDAYDVQQTISTIKLVKYLCNTFNIPKKLISNKNKFDFDTSILDSFSGIYTHSNVRADKSDLCPAWNWELLELQLNS